MEEIWVVSVDSNDSEIESEKFAFKSKQKALNKRNELIDWVRSCLDLADDEIGECAYDSDYHSMYEIVVIATGNKITISHDLVKLY
jgi:hypothetical protein